MTSRIIKSLVFVACLLYGHTALSKQIFLDLSITGFTSRVKLDAVVQFYSRPEIAPTSKTITNEERNNYGHFVQKIETGYETDEISRLYILGRIRNAVGEEVGYIPIFILDKSDLNDRGFAKVSIQSYTDVSRAFLNSFPFSHGFHAGFINNDNLEQVLFATQLLIEKGYVDGERWNAVFSSFLQNIQFFKDNNPQIGRILKFLRTYGNLTNNKKYYEFYAKTLVKLDKLDVDGTDVAPNETLGRYVQKEWETLLIDHTYSVVPVVRSMIETLFEEKRYSECINLSGLAFKQFQAQEVINEAVNNGEFRNYILSAMQGATECFQLDFATRSDRGSRSDVKGATSFLREDEEAKSDVNYFIELYETLEKKGCLPRRPEKVLSQSEASRINQIGKYYWWLTEK